MVMPSSASRGDCAASPAPRSASTTCQPPWSSASGYRFSGFRSLWMMPISCSAATASHSCTHSDRRVARSSTGRPPAAAAQSARWPSAKNGSSRKNGGWLRFQSITGATLGQLRFHRADVARQRDLALEAAQAGLAGGQLDRAAFRRDSDWARKITPALPSPRRRPSRQPGRCGRRSPSCRRPASCGCAVTLLDGDRLEADRGRQPVAIAVHDAECLAVLAERLAQAADGLGQRILRHDPARPAGLEQFVLGHDLAGMAQQRQQHVVGAAVELDRGCPTRSAATCSSSTPSPLPHTPGLLDRTHAPRHRPAARLPPR